MFYPLYHKVLVNLKDLVNLIYLADILKKLNKQVLRKVYIYSIHY